MTKQAETTKSAYIVSYRRDENSVCCTNIAIAECREDVEAEYSDSNFLAINPAKDHEVEALRKRGCPVIECEHIESEPAITNEQHRVNFDLVIRAGLKAMIAENMGFDPKRVKLLEMGSENNMPTWVAFDVMGQGYTWNLENHTFAIANQYGDIFFGEDE